MLDQLPARHAHQQLPDRRRLRQRRAGSRRSRLHAYVQRTRAVSNRVSVQEREGERAGVHRPTRHLKPKLLCLASAAQQKTTSAGQQAAFVAGANNGFVERTSELKRN